jgi:hypothetical protein
MTEEENIVHSVNQAFAGLLDVLLGPRAPTRRRPRRVLKKIAARRGRARYPIALFRRRPEAEPRGGDWQYSDLSTGAEP